MKGVSAMLISILVGLIIGLLGAVTILAASANSGNLQINAKAITQDTEIVKMIYMGKNLEWYSEFSEQEFRDFYFQTGGPQYCGSLALGGLELSIWSNQSSGCTYSGNPLEDELEQASVSRIVSLIMTSFSDITSRWNVLAGYENMEFSLSKTGSQLPGMPTIRAVLDFDWRYIPADIGSMTDAMKTALGAVAESYQVTDDCRLYNGTLEYEGGDYGFNIIRCI